MEMTTTQQKALDLYLESATLENDYKPLTYIQLSEKLKKYDINVGKSTLQRWGTKFQFEKHLEKKLQLIVIKEEDKTPEEKALKTVIQKDLVTVEKNGQLMSKSYGILNRFLDETIEAYEGGRRVSRDDLKLVKDIAVLTAGREDKLMDRLANSSGEKLSLEELKEEFEMIDLDIEDD